MATENSTAEEMLVEVIGQRDEARLALSLAKGEIERLKAALEPLLMLTALYEDAKSNPHGIQRAKEQRDIAAKIGFAFIKNATALSPPSTGSGG